ncbi:hypothetical protein HDU93_005140 [Gonapodya sp. JEL0774]|nr:hypothetical protein HDU93_005140 [Gonapodya sp. JEL0774]
MAGARRVAGGTDGQRSAQFMMLSGKPEYHCDALGNDRERLVEILQDPIVHRNTLQLPKPYTLESADWWITETRNRALRERRTLNFAIRELPSQLLVGSAGFHDLKLVKEIDGELRELEGGDREWKTEIGYYLDANYRGKGIMPMVVTKLCELGFGELGLERISANIFAYNHASARVVEKCGFVLEGRLRKYYRKDGALIDGQLWARVKE